VSANGQPVFYYDTNSPFAYLAANRIGELIPDAVWKPVALPIIFRAIGKVPWSLSDRRPAGTAEIERRAGERGLPPVTWPEGWPAETWSWTPLRAAIIADDEGRQSEFALAAYRKIFAEDRSLDELENVLAAAADAGLDPDAVEARLGDDDVKERLRANTDEAIELGAVGVPTVAVGGELFWGDDRLEEAAAAAAAGQPSTT
jgi:2-hydroxychromene-2-carboxylate isomerase